MSQPIPQRILVVEDEVIVALDLEARLSDMGYLVLGPAHSGEEAVEIALRERPDLVLLDINLGQGIDGAEVARQVRERIDVPTIFLTAHSDPATIERVKRLSPMGYLIKPFNERELRSSIEIALYKHTTEAKLRDLERWLSMTLRSIGDAVLSVDLQGHVTYLNPIAARLLEWELEEAAGRHVDEVFPLVSLEDGIPVPSPVRRVLSEGIVVELAPGVGVRSRSGVVIPIGDSAAPLRDERDHTSGVVIVFRDISAQLENDARLRLLEQQLQHAQRLESIGTLAGGIAHDFNNMLVAISGFAELALDLTQTADPCRPYLENVERTCRRAAKLTRQLLAFGRRQVLQPVRVDPKPALAALSSILRRLIREDIDLRLELADAVSPIHFDTSQLEQVLINLVVNARDALPTGGTIWIEASDVQVAEPLLAFGEELPAGQYVRLRVRDDGQGIPPEALPRVFEPYFTTKEAGKGTGLGLAMVHGIVRQSGGFLQLQSAPGEGTMVSLFIPPSREARLPASVEGPAALAEPRPSGSGTILLVEDDDLVRTTLLRSLERAGYRVLPVSEAAEARRLAAEQREAIRLIVCDVVLPSGCGAKLVEELRTHCREAGVVLVSGYPRGHVVEKGLPEDTHYLQKPFPPSTLTRLVTSTLSNRERALSSRGDRVGRRAQRAPDSSRHART